MSKIIEFENVYIELPEAYVLEENTQQEEIVEETINSEIDIKPLEEEVVQEDDLMTAEEIIEEALNDIEEEKEEDEAVTKQATTKLSFAELQKRLEESQSLHQ